MKGETFIACSALDFIFYDQNHCCLLQPVAEFCTYKRELKKMKIREQLAFNAPIALPQSNTNCLRFKETTTRRNYSARAFLVSLLEAHMTQIMQNVLNRCQLNVFCLLVFRFSFSIKEFQKFLFVERRKTANNLFDIWSNVAISCKLNNWFLDLHNWTILSFLFSRCASCWFPFYCSTRITKENSRSLRNERILFEVKLSRRREFMIRLGVIPRSRCNNERTSCSLDLHQTFITIIKFDQKSNNSKF